MAVIRLVAGRCIRERHAGAKCAACADACPARALSFEGASLRVTAPACEGCGACAAACPANAISLPAPGWREAVAHLASSGTLECRCSRARAGEGAPVPCFAALSRTERLELLKAGVRSLRMATGACEGCPSEPRGGENAWREFVVDMRRTASAFGRTIVVERSTEPVPDIDGGRRHLLGIVVRKSSAPAAPERIEDAMPDRAAGRILLSDASKRRLLAVRALAAAAPDSASAKRAGLADLRVPVMSEEKCTACGLCAAACPQHALMAKTEGDVFTISAVEAACTGCGLCADICIPKAVAFEAPVNADAWLTGRPIEKLSVKGGRRRSAWDGIVGRSFSSGSFSS